MISNQEKEFPDYIRKKEKDDGKFGPPNLTCASATSQHKHLFLKLTRRDGHY